MAINHSQFARLFLAQLAEASLTIDRQYNRIRERVWALDDEFGGAPDLVPNWTGDILSDLELAGLVVSLTDAKQLVEEAIDSAERAWTESREATVRAVAIETQRESRKSLWRRAARRVLERAR